MYLLQNYLLIPGKLHLSIQELDKLTWSDKGI